jgi:hypothetical protein
MSQQPNIETLMLTYFLSLADDLDNSFAGAVMGFQFALGLARHEPAFMAEMARHMVIGVPLPADVAADFKTYIENGLRSIS